MKTSSKILAFILMVLSPIGYTEAIGKPQSPTEFSVCDSLDLAPSDSLLVYHQYEDSGEKFTIFLLGDRSVPTLVLLDHDPDSESRHEGNGNAKRVPIDAELRSKLLERFTKALLSANKERIRATTGSTHYYISVRSDDGAVSCGEAIEALPDSQVMEIRALGRVMRKLVEETEPENQRPVRRKLDALLH